MNDSPERDFYEVRQSYNLTESIPDSILVSSEPEVEPERPAVLQAALRAGACAPARYRRSGTGLINEAPPVPATPSGWVPSIEAARRAAAELRQLVVDARRLSGLDTTPKQ
jgi:hypothetical protein